MRVDFESIVVKALNSQRIQNLGLSNEARTTILAAMLDTAVHSMPHEFVEYGLNLVQICSHREVLYGVDSDGEVWKYSPTRQGWERIGMAVLPVIPALPDVPR